MSFFDDEENQEQESPPSPPEEDEQEEQEQPSGGTPDEGKKEERREGNQDDRIDQAKKLKDKFDKGHDEKKPGEGSGEEEASGKESGELGKSAGKETGKQAADTTGKGVEEGAKKTGEHAAEEGTKQAGKAAAEKGATSAAQGAAQGGATTAAEGGALAATEGATAGAGVATSETGVGALVAALIILAIEALKLAFAALKSAFSGNSEAFEKEALKWPKRFMWISIVALLLLVFIVMAIMVLLAGDEARKKETTGTLTVTKTSDRPDGLAGPNQYIKYTIHAVSSVPTTNITITDKVPDHTELYEEFKEYKDFKDKSYDKTTRIIKWESKSTANSSDITVSFQVRVDPDVKPMRIINIATATSAGGSSTGVSGYVPPAAANSCGGKYASYISKNWVLTMNYGDPVCSYVKDQQYALLKLKDPQFADLWFLTITPGESGYNPNAWADPKKNGQGAIDPGGAWGLYQMGSTARVNTSTWAILSPAGLPPPSPGKVGIYDRGDVNWEMQTTNAIAHNRSHHCIFRYWATAKAYWYKYSC